jgi:CheY-like chemotaxis protein
MKKKSILIVDDDAFVRMIIREKLKVANFAISITDAVSGNHAINLLENGEKYDVIISDYYMIDGSGADLLRFIYANSIVVPFALFTSSISPELPVTDSQFLGIVEKLNIHELTDIIKMNLSY